jgi:hypothetical protein
MTQPKTNAKIRIAVDKKYHLYHNENMKKTIASPMAIPGYCLLPGEIPSHNPALAACGRGNGGA